MNRAITLIVPAPILIMDDREMALDFAVIHPLYHAETALVNVHVPINYTSYLKKIILVILPLSLTAISTLRLSHIHYVYIENDNIFLIILNFINFLFLIRFGVYR